MLAGSDGKAHQQKVEIGIKQGDQVQITKGLQPNQTVITSGAYGLPDNTKIKVAQAAPPPEEKPSGDKSDKKDDKD